jgi:hypothetical protein
MRTARGTRPWEAILVSQQRKAQRFLVVLAIRLRCLRDDEHSQS